MRPPHATMPRHGPDARRRRAVQVIGAMFGVMVLLTGGSYAGRFWTNNFHTIVAGEAYRSAQPSPAELRQYKRDYGIAAIINLRRGKAGDSWYDAEVATARHLGIRHFDFPMSASRTLSRGQSRNLLALLRAVPKPVLIHCRAGADRSGLAAAFYLAGVARADEQAAESQLSLRYGHIALPYLGTIQMDWSFEVMESVFGFYDS